MLRQPSLAFVLLLTGALAGCSRSSSVAGPTPPIERPGPEVGSTGFGGPGVLAYGWVMDAAERPLVGALVEVVEGPHAGLQTKADANGYFRLMGAWDETSRVRASLEGYVTSTWPFTKSGLTFSWVPVHLASAAAHEDLDGDYTLTFLAHASCTSLPEARERSYRAKLTLASDPSTARYDVTLEGEPFKTPYDRFTIGVSGDYVGAYMGDWGHSVPGLVEQVDDVTFPTLAGSLTGKVTGSTITGAFDGMVDRCVLIGETTWGTCLYNAAGPVRHTACESFSHQLLLTRR